MRGHALIHLPLPLGSVDAPVETLAPCPRRPCAAENYLSTLVAQSRSGHGGGRRVNEGVFWGSFPSRLSLCFDLGAALRSLENSDQSRFWRCVFLSDPRQTLHPYPRHHRSQDNSSVEQLGMARLPCCLPLLEPWAAVSLHQNYFASIGSFPLGDPRQTNPGHRWHGQSGVALESTHLGPNGRIPAVMP